MTDPPQSTGCLLLMAQALWGAELPRCPGPSDSLLLAGVMAAHRRDEGSCSSCPLTRLPPRSDLDGVGAMCSTHLGPGGGNAGQRHCPAFGAAACTQSRLQGVFPCRVARFSSVNHLSIHFPKNFGAETTKIFYIGLKGEWTEVGLSRAKLSRTGLVGYGELWLTARAGLS